MSQNWSEPSLVMICIILLKEISLLYYVRVSDKFQSNAPKSGAGV